MFVADHGLIVSQANGDVRTDHIPSHGRSIPSPCQEKRDPSAAAAAANHPVIPEHRTHRVKEVTMTRRVRLWMTAVLSIAATALMVSLAVAAQAGVNHAHTHPPLAGISFNGLD